jgi:hypothetical protein
MEKVSLNILLKRLSVRTNIICKLHNLGLNKIKVLPVKLRITGSLMLENNYLF